MSKITEDISVSISKQWDELHFHFIHNGEHAMQVGTNCNGRLVPAGDCMMCFTCYKVWNIPYDNLEMATRMRMWDE
jgi:hypothetical protein